MKILNSLKEFVSFEFTRIEFFPFFEKILHFDTESKIITQQQSKYFSNKINLYQNSVRNHIIRVIIYHTA